jgi:hypothetical protein
MSGTMDGIARACLVCLAELGPDARQCPRCGHPAAASTPELVVPGMRPRVQGPRLQGPLSQGPLSQGPLSQGPLSQGPPPQGPRQPPRRHDRPRSGSSAGPWVVVLALLLCGGAAALLLANPFGHHSAGAGTGQADPAGTASARPAASVTAGSAASGSPAAPASASASVPVTEQQAAKGVSVLLARSASDRTAITRAANDVSACGTDLAADLGTFDSSATSRKAMLSSLSALPSRATLPAALLSDLAAAWQASIVADQSYARWASDELAKPCVRGDTSDPGFQATIAPNASATQDKTAFVDGWNQIAARYGLAQYQQGQL